MENMWDILKISWYLENAELIQQSEDDFRQLDRSFSQIVDSLCSNSLYSNVCNSHYYSILNTTPRDTSFKVILSFFLMTSEAYVEDLLKFMPSNKADDHRSNNNYAAASKNMVEDLLAAQEHFGRQQREKWRLLQELLHLAMEADHSLHSFAEKIVTSLIKNGLVASLLQHLQILATWSYLPFRLDHVTLSSSSSYSASLVENLQQRHHLVWEQLYRVELQQTLDALLLLSYQRQPLQAAQLQQLLALFLHHPDTAFYLIQHGARAKEEESKGELQGQLLHLLLAALQLWRRVTPGGHEEEEEEEEAGPGAIDSLWAGQEDKVEEIDRLLASPHGSRLLTVDMLRVLRYFWQLTNKSRLSGSGLLLTSRTLMPSTVVCEALEATLLQLAVHQQLPRGPSAHRAIAAVLYQSMILQEVLAVYIEEQVLGQEQGVFSSLAFIAQALSFAYQGREDLCSGLAGLWLQQQQQVSAATATAQQHPVLRLIELLLMNTASASVPLTAEAEAAHCLLTILTALAASAELRALLCDLLSRPVCIISAASIEQLQYREGSLQQQQQLTMMMMSSRSGGGEEEPDRSYETTSQWSAFQDLVLHGGSSSSAEREHLEDHVALIPAGPIRGMRLRYCEEEAAHRHPHDDDEQELREEEGSRGGTKRRTAAVRRRLNLSGHHGSQEEGEEEEEERFTIHMYAYRRPQRQGQEGELSAGLAEEKRSHGSSLSLLDQRSLAQQLQTSLYQPRSGDEGILVDYLDDEGEAAGQGQGPQLVTVLWDRRYPWWTLLLDRLVQQSEAMARSTAAGRDLAAMLQLLAALGGDEKSQLYLQRQLSRQWQELLVYLLLRQAGLEDLFAQVVALYRQQQQQQDGSDSGHHLQLDSLLQVCQLVLMQEQGEEEEDEQLGGGRGAMPRMAGLLSELTLAGSRRCSLYLQSFEEFLGHAAVRLLRAAMLPSSSSQRLGQALQLLQQLTAQNLFVTGIIVQDLLELFPMIGSDEAVFLRLFERLSWQLLGDEGEGQQPGQRAGAATSQLASWIQGLLEKLVVLVKIQDSRTSARATDENRDATSSSSALVVSQLAPPPSSSSSSSSSAAMTTVGHNLQAFYRAALRYLTAAALSRSDIMEQDASSLLGSLLSLLQTLLTCYPIVVHHSQEAASDCSLDSGSLWTLLQGSLLQKEVLSLLLQLSVGIPAAWERHRQAQLAEEEGEEQRRKTAAGSRKGSIFQTSSWLSTASERQEGERGGGGLETNVAVLLARGEVSPADLQQAMRLSSQALQLVGAMIHLQASLIPVILELCTQPLSLQDPLGLTGGGAAATIQTTADASSYPLLLALFSLPALQQLGLDLYLDKLQLRSQAVHLLVLLLPHTKLIKQPAVTIAAAAAATSASLPSSTSPSSTSSSWLVQVLGMSKVLLLHDLFLQVLDDEEDEAMRSSSAAATAGSGEGGDSSCSYLVWQLMAAVMDSHPVAFGLIFAASTSSSFSSSGELPLPQVIARLSSQLVHHPDHERLYRDQPRLYASQLRFLHSLMRQATTWPAIGKVLAQLAGSSGQQQQLTSFWRNMLLAPLLALEPSAPARPIESIRMLDQSQQRSADFLSYEQVISSCDSAEDVYDLLQLLRPSCPSPALATVLRDLATSSAQCQVLSAVLDILALERYGLLYEVSLELGSKVSQEMTKLYSQPAIKNRFMTWLRQYLRLFDYSADLLQVQQLSHSLGWSLERELVAVAAAEVKGDSTGQAQVLQETIYHLYLQLLGSGSDDGSLAPRQLQLIDELCRLANDLTKLTLHLQIAQQDLQLFSSCQTFLTIFVLPGGSRIKTYVHRLEQQKESAAASQPPQVFFGTPGGDGSSKGRGQQQPGPSHSQHGIIPESPIVGTLSPVTSSAADASPITLRESSFAGDKRSYEVVAEILNSLSSSSPSSSSPSAAPTILGLAGLHLKSELLMSMLHHQVKVVGFVDADPVKSEVSSRDIGSARLTLDKMEKLLARLVDLYDHLGLGLGLELTGDHQVAADPVAVTSLAASLHGLSMSQLLVVCQPSSSQVQPHQQPAVVQRMTSMHRQSIANFFAMFVLLLTSIQRNSSSSSLGQGGGVSAAFTGQQESLRRRLFALSYRHLLVALQGHGLAVCLPANHEPGQLPLDPSQRQTARLALQLLPLCLPSSASSSSSAVDREAWQQLLGEQLQLEPFLTQLGQLVQETYQQTTAATSGSSSAETAARLKAMPRLLAGLYSGEEQMPQVSQAIWQALWQQDSLASPPSTDSATSTARLASLAATSCQLYDLWRALLSSRLLMRQQHQAGGGGGSLVQLLQSLVHDPIIAHYAQRCLPAGEGGDRLDLGLASLLAMGYGPLADQLSLAFEKWLLVWQELLLLYREEDEEQPTCLLLRGLRDLFARYEMLLLLPFQSLLQETQLRFTTRQLHLQRVLLALWTVIQQHPACQPLFFQPRRTAEHSWLANAYSRVYEAAKVWHCRWIWLVTGQEVLHHREQLDLAPQPQDVEEKEERLRRRLLAQLLLVHPQEIRREHQRGLLASGGGQGLELEETAEAAAATIAASNKAVHFGSDQVFMLPSSVASSASSSSSLSKASSSSPQRSLQGSYGGSRTMAGLSSTPRSILKGLHPEETASSLPQLGLHQQETATALGQAQHWLLAELSPSWQGLLVFLRQHQQLLLAALTSTSSSHSRISSSEDGQGCCWQVGDMVSYLSRAADEEEVLYAAEIVKVTSRYDNSNNSNRRLAYDVKLLSTHQVDYGVTAEQIKHRYYYPTLLIFRPTADLHARDADTLYEQQRRQQHTTREGVAVQQRAQLLSTAHALRLLLLHSLPTMLHSNQPPRPLQQSLVAEQFVLLVMCLDQVSQAPLQQEVAAMLQQVLELTCPLQTMRRRLVLHGDSQPVSAVRSSTTAAALQSSWSWTRQLAQLRQSGRWEQLLASLEAYLLEIYYRLHGPLQHTAALPPDLPAAKAEVEPAADQPREVMKGLRKKTAWVR